MIILAELINKAEMKKLIFMINKPLNKENYKIWMMM